MDDVVFQILGILGMSQNNLGNPLSIARHDLKKSAVDWLNSSQLANQWKALR